MGCDLSHENLFTAKCDFNPRTHVGCDFNISVRIHRIPISIHAPTWGATPPQEVGVRPVGISIHAPTWGATSSRDENRSSRDISIHAPTWGATYQNSWSVRIQEISIHAPTWGATRQHYYAQATVAKFQSTHPRGVRLGRKYPPKHHK